MKEILPNIFNFIAVYIKHNSHFYAIDYSYISFKPYYVQV